MTSTEARPAARAEVARTRRGRLIEGQTAFDFVGHRNVGFTISLILIVVTVISLFAQGLNLGIDFTGGVSWDVPAENFTVGDAEDVLADNGLSADGARLQRRESDSGEFVKVQVGTQTEEVTSELRADFAEVAGVTTDEVNVTLVSSSWGSEITEKAVRALVIFVLLVSIFISIRFEWRMAVASIVAMLHDVVISIGIYSVFQFVVTPPTVIAFLTILGYSLYDTIVVFDRVKENEARFAAHKPPYDDVINVSMNQVLMRTLSTSFSSIVPVLTLLIIGAWMMGQSTLSEFAVALLVGMITGAYSSILIATPLLGMLKKTGSSWEARKIPRVVGEPLREMVMSGEVGSRRIREEAVEGGSKRRRARKDAATTIGMETADSPTDDTVAATTTPTTGGAAAAKPAAGTTTKAAGAATALSHPPRPRKKKRR